MTYAIAALLALSIATVADAGTFSNAPHNGVPDKYLVILAEGVAAKPGKPGSGKPRAAQVAREMAAAHGGNVTEVWEHAARGFVIRLPEARARRLAEDPRVASVEQDFSISAAVTLCSVSQTMSQNSRPPWNPNVSPQVLDCSDPDPAHDTEPGPPLCRDNWGLDRIDNDIDDERYYFGNTASSVHVYIMDSGIRTTHVEFQGRIGTGKDATINPEDPNPPPATVEDCHGHGTHVAGIIGGRTYGVAKNVTLHPVKIDYIPNGTYPCPKTSFTWYVSAAARGLDWIVANAEPPAIVNWSGANTTGLANNATLKTHLEGVLNAGILVVQSAGNHPLSTDACDTTFAGTYPEVVVAAGTDYYEGRMKTSDDFASTTGSCVDVWAPATQVISAWRTGDTDLCRQTGTSMAAPHVTGVAALYLQNNQSATPAEVARALRSRGTWNILQSNESHPNYIGVDSDNVFLSANTLAMGSDTAPVAFFTVTCPGLQCTFDASASTDDVAVAAYEWRFGDGTTGSGAVTQHAYASLGSYIAVLEVRDSVTAGTGKTDHLRKTAAVTNADAPPTASFTVSCTGLVCTFDSSASSDAQGISSRTWKFGDGGTGSGTIANRSYPTAGTYVVELLVTDTVGQTATTQTSVTVLTAPQNLLASASGSSVVVTWNAVPSATSYIVERKTSTLGGWTPLPSTAATSLADNTPTTNGITLYRVRATATNVLSDYSETDSSWTGTFTDDPVSTSPPTTATGIKAVHITELRAIVNAFRIFHNQVETYTAAQLNPTNLQNQSIDGNDMELLRQNFVAARSAAGVTTPMIYNMPLPALNGEIRATHVVDLRNAVK